MCNCIEEIEERIKNELSFKNDDYKNKKITKAEMQNKAFMFNENQPSQTTTPMQIHYEALNKKKVLVSKKEVINLTHSYCPFCGCKYN